MKNKKHRVKTSRPSVEINEVLKPAYNVRKKKKRELDKILDQAKKIARDVLIKTEDFDEVCGDEIKKLTRG